MVGHMGEFLSYTKCGVWVKEQEKDPCAALWIACIYLRGLMEENHE